MAKKAKFQPPTVQDVQLYINQEGYDVNAAEFVKYYEAGEPPWHDQNGKQVRSWKQKLIAVWARKPKAKKCVKCPKMGTYVSEDDSGHKYWLCEAHKPKPKLAGFPKVEMKSVPGGVNINDERNRQKNELGVR